MRTSISEFSLEKPLYAAATVAFYTVDANGAKTSTLATLYGSVAGPDLLPNPQTLDSSGRFAQPVYIERPVIAVVSSPRVPSHETGIISSPLVGRRVISTATDFTFTVAHSFSVLEVDATAGARTATLLSAATAPRDFIVMVKKVDASANPVTVLAAGGALIDGRASVVLRKQWQYVEAIYNGSAYLVVGRSPAFV